VGAMAQPSALRHKRGTRALGRGAQDGERRGAVRQASPTVELRLVNGFELLCDGEPVELPLTAQRLVAFLALQERPLQRGYVAARLWLDTVEERAFGSLRSAIWRVKQTEIPLLKTPDTRLALDPAVRVDLADALGLARLLISDEAGVGPWPVDLAPLKGEILPDWYDDWIAIERETHRQLRLHALEAMAVRLGAAERFGEAIEAALAAIAGEPLRESAHRTLCRVYLAEGNATEALRHATLYRELLWRELQLRPGPQFDELVAGVTPG
jgi:DNA-binding SARP family transcriptional activator